MCCPADKVTTLENGHIDSEGNVKQLTVHIYIYNLVNKDLNSLNLLYQIHRRMKKKDVNVN